MTKKDFDAFEKLCEYQCAADDIADTLGRPIDDIMHQSLLYYGKIWNLTDEEKEEFTWKKLVRRLGARGRIKLHKYQWNHAEFSADMAKFLGKQYLGQVENPQNDTDNGNIAQLINAFNALKNGNKND